MGAVMKRLSKVFYISAMGAFIPGFFLFVLGAAESEERTKIGPPLLFLVLLFCYVLWW